jgi:retron-type reverse transcriptase
MMTKEVAKSLPISKRMVYDSYLKVMEKKGSAGIDNVSIEVFNKDLFGNLYKIWNRMASGSYFPTPVRTVFCRRCRVYHLINPLITLFKHKSISSRIPIFPQKSPSFKF